VLLDQALEPRAVYESKVKIRGDLVRHGLTFASHLARDRDDPHA
jgi:hypothetical protein